MSLRTSSNDVAPINADIEYLAYRVRFRMFSVSRSALYVWAINAYMGHLAHRVRFRMFTLSIPMLDI